MSVVIPFDRCIARPGNGQKKDIKLSTHLYRVALAWEKAAPKMTRAKILARVSTVVSTGTSLFPDQEHHLEKPCSRVDPFQWLCRRLLFLGGLVHDAGKARTSWQEYIRDASKKNERARVFHAPSGAALYYYASRCFLDYITDKYPDLRSYTSSHQIGLFRAGITLDIADHHGDLSDIQSTAPWEQGGFSSRHLQEIDLRGFFSFVCNFFPDMELDPNKVMPYLTKAAKEWRKVFSISRIQVKRQLKRLPEPYLEASSYCLCLRTSGLITADRFDAAMMTRITLDPQTARRGLKQLVHFLEQKAEEALRKGASPSLVSARKMAQDKALSQYLDCEDKGIFQLNLPTGLGKTMAALRIALTACARGTTERIVYVAPYIAILSQATSEIRSASGIETLQHHHLSSLNTLEADELYHLTQESWQAPIVTTTFNQLFLALFPRRAQHTLRLDALRNAFIVIDEPQIVESRVWKLFLRLLEALARELNAKVLFTTATMPPTDNGLSRPPVSLYRGWINLPSRYCIDWDDKTLNLDGLVALVQASLDQAKTVAVVMNTIRHATSLYDLLRKERSECARRASFDNQTKLFYVSGAMTPLHKSNVIKDIRKTLEKQQKAVVVSTQVLEAGVDLSFYQVLRELPIVPSIVQMAGRANRHGESPTPARVKVFRFVDEKGRQPRGWIYTSKVWQEETDALLEKYRGRWDECSTGQILREFYEACYRRSPDEALLDYLLDGATGVGSALRGIQPFEERFKQIDVFVPWSKEIPAYVRQAMTHFGVNNCEELYDLYIEPGFVSGLPFLERKRFFALLQHFTVPVDWNTAKTVADSGGDRAIWRLADPKYYNEETGLVKAGETDVSYLFI